jgi:hypothetical protein
MALGLTASFIMPSAHSANWLMLQGTEPAGAAARAKVWGFVQAQYQNDRSDPNAGGGYNPPKLIGPNLDSQSAFNVNRARIGVRGTGFPLDSNVNYFILAEFGNNGITYGDEGKNLTDASITLNHIDGARVRVGMFKYPGAEEGLQAIHVFDYINFTTVTNQLLLERFPNSFCEGGSPSAGPCTQTMDANNSATATPDADLNQFSKSVGAFRDVGIQIFDTFKMNDWEHSYAVMMGNGNGLNYSDNDDNKDLYLYASSEKVFGGKGGRREGLKFLAWHQDGTRTKADDRTQEQDRTRSGIGVKYLQRPFRASAEYMTGEGMIFQGQHRPQHLFNDLDASGYYVEAGYYIPNTKWEIDFRIDSYTRDENFRQPPTSPATPSAPGDESTFDTITVGTQYHFNKKTRMNAEYLSRDAESDTGAIEGNVKDIGGRFAIQITHIF